MSDVILTSSDKTDIETRYINETTKKCISNANPRPTERLILRKCAPRLGQKHFLTPRNAVQLPRKNSLIVSLYASLDRSRSSFNRARIALITVNCKIMHSTQRFPLFLEIACMRQLAQNTACSLRLETCPKPQFSKMSPAPRPKPLFDCKCPMLATPDHGLGPSMHLDRRMSTHEVAYLLQAAGRGCCSLHPLCTPGQHNHQCHVVICIIAHYSTTTCPTHSG